MVSGTDQTMEQRPIEGFERYCICEDGTVINSKTGRKLKTRVNSNGYVQVNLYLDGRLFTKTLHTLLAKAFLAPRSECVNHKDGNKTNNALSNLEWTTRQQNVQHSYDNGLQNQKGSVNGRAKLREQEVLEIRNSDKGNRELANLFGVSIATIQQIKRRATWTHV